MRVEANLDLWPQLNTNIYYEKFEEISDLKILQVASAGHWKHCGGPHLALGPLSAHPCTSAYVRKLDFQANLCEAFSED